MKCQEAYIRTMPSITIIIAYIQTTREISHEGHRFVFLAPTPPAKRPRLLRLDFDFWWPCCTAGVGLAVLAAEFGRVCFGGTSGGCAFSFS